MGDVLIIGGTVNSHCSLMCYKRDEFGEFEEAMHMTLGKS